ncbi:S-adenosyl-L-methionine-dependent methyltransferase [Xylariaceae sp. FL1651]|nr:S-adenosyl-L-methionine-dependent methyltransferase [Xylariaceae sp. FL1651]
MAEERPTSTQYDALATSYDLIWQTPAVRPLLPLLTSTIAALGPFTNASVLDLACGTGLGLRLLRRAGASTLVGIDISAEMLSVAALTVPLASLHAADCSKPLSHIPGLQPASFDVVLGMWLLNYCPSSAEMAGMWANVATYLRPGGRFVGIIENPEIVHPVGLRSFKYGAMESGLTELENGQGWRVHVAFATEPRIEFDAFRLRKDVMEAEARSAGMDQLTYGKPDWDEVRAVISEGVGGEEGREESWWTDLVEEAPNLVLTATRE